MRPSDYLKQGWCQRTSRQRADGRVAGLGEPAVRWCMIGAIRQAGSDYHITLHQSDMLQHQLHRAVSGNFVNWQDEPGRTQAEVVAVMEAAERQVLG